jgi:ankyrin repeat protein
MNKPNDFLCHIVLTNEPALTPSQRAPRAKSDLRRVDRLRRWLSTGAIAFLLAGCASIKKDFDQAKAQNSAVSYKLFLQKYDRNGMSESDRAFVEEIQWLTIKNKPSRAQYEAYLKRYPAGRFKDEASRGLEEHVWKETRTIRDERSYKAYLEQFPSGRYASAATASLDDLHWTRASRTNSIAAYRAYLASGSGGHGREAQARIDKLSDEVAWKQARDTDTIDAYQEYVIKNPSGKFVLAAEQGQRSLNLKAAKTTFSMKLGACKSIDEVEQLRREETDKEVASLAIPIIEEMLADKARADPNRVTVEALKANHLKSRLGGRNPISTNGHLVVSFMYNDSSEISSLPGSITFVDSIDFRDRGSDNPPMAVNTFQNGTLTFLWFDFPQDKMGFGSSANELLSRGFGTKENPAKADSFVLSGVGSIHRFARTVKVGNYTFIGEGDRENRLTFLLLDEGYVYLRGKGRVIPPAPGEEMKFGYSSEPGAGAGARPKATASESLAKNGNGALTLHEACKEGNLEKVKTEIASGVGVDAKDEDGNPPLHWAVVKGRLPIVQYLVSNRADVNARDASGGTALQKAVAFGSDPIVTYLIKHGADVNAKSEQGLTALHIAAVVNNHELAKVLVAAGANANPKTQLRTPLHLAAEKGNTKMVTLLLDGGADINAKDENDFTPLHWAVNQHRVSLAESLLKRGADRNARDKKGRTALQLAKENQFEDIVTILNTAN